MNLRILCLDDNLETLNQPLQDVFGSMCVRGKVPNLFGGSSKPFSVRGFGERTLTVEIVSNAQNNPVKVCQEIQDLSNTQKFDIVLVDDNWGQFGNTEGQNRLLPVVISSITGLCSELPVLVLFTQHWEQVDRVRAFCGLMDQFQSEQRRLTGLHKNDSSGLMLLIQRVISEKKILQDRELIAAENRVLRELIGPVPKNMIGSSPSMLKVYRTINAVAPAQTSILILGETGTGKELVARAIHNGSPRKNGPFIAVNCAAIPANLIESELFGTERGAYTGADKARKGKFELASGGTLFLDEIGDMSPLTQSKVLRALQEREVTRVGGTTPKAVDIRIIAATSRDLKSRIHSGEFREDLYYRLNVIEIDLPPLRERGNDILLLAEEFLENFQVKSQREINGFSRKVEEYLLSYHWPGNVRELQNVIESAVVFCRDTQIDTADLPPSMTSTRQFGKALLRDSKNIWDDDRSTQIDPEILARAKKLLDKYEKTCRESDSSTLTQGQLDDTSHSAVSQNFKTYRAAFDELFERFPNRYENLLNKTKAKRWGKD